MRTDALIRDAVRSLLRYKLRSGLTMLGITIGIAAVVLVVAIGQAGKERAEDALRTCRRSLSGLAGSEPGPDRGAAP